jgi:hypothetical protein
MTTERRTADNTGLAKVAVQCSADTFVLNQSLVLRINICGENRHLRQARKRLCLIVKRQPTAHFSTFGFARHDSRPFAKPKELKFSHRTQTVNNLSTTT